MSEMYFKIPGFDDYEITLDGVVRSLKSGKIMKTQKTPNNRLFVILYQNKKRYNRLVHRLVYEAIAGDAEGVIKHRDGDFENNHIDNLYVTDQSSNVRIANKGRLRGVERYKKTDRWMVRFAIHGKREFFGIYDSKPEAYRVYYRVYKEIFDEEPFNEELLKEL